MKVLIENNIIDLIYIRIFQFDFKLSIINLPLTYIHRADKASLNKVKALLIIQSQSVRFQHNVCIKQTINKVKLKKLITKINNNP